MPRGRGPGALSYNAKVRVAFTLPTGMPYCFFYSYAWRHQGALAASLTRAVELPPFYFHRVMLLGGAGLGRQGGAGTAMRPLKTVMPGSTNKKPFGKYLPERTPLGFLWYRQGRPRPLVYP